MPNYLKNVVKITGSKEEIDSLMNFVSNETGKYKSEFCFDNIDPMPHEDEMPEKYKKGPLPSYYYWQYENWGTTWTALDIEVNRVNPEMVHYTFLTGWVAPIPVLIALSRKYQQIQIELEYADEDLGNNVGSVKIQNGAILEENIPEEGSNEAIKKTIDLWGLQDNYKLVDGEYIHTPKNKPN